MFSTLNPLSRDIFDDCNDEKTLYRNQEPTQFVSHFYKSVSYFLHKYNFLSYLYLLVCHCWCRDVTQHWWQLGFWSKPQTVAKEGRNRRLNLHTRSPNKVAIRLTQAWLTKRWMEWKWVQAKEKLPK